LNAVLRCQMDQLQRDNEERSSPSGSDTKMMVKLVDYLRNHRRQFWNLNKSRPRLGGTQPAFGYRIKSKGQRWYFLTADQFNAVVGTGAAAKALKQTLANDGLLARTKNKFVVQRCIYSGGKKNQNFAWVHAIKAEILQKQE
jgi:hypothetical protein